jgi:hypothetical protein
MSSEDTEFTGFTLHEVRGTGFLIDFIVGIDVYEVDSVDGQFKDDA